MTRYLLDTNIISNIVRFPTGAAFKRLSEVGHTSVFTSIIVAAEIRFGIEKENSVALSNKVNAVLSRITIVSFEAPADAFYAKIRAALDKQRNTIGPNDLFIAAHALAQDAVLVTNNEREFSRVPDLKIENWLSES